MAQALPNNINEKCSRDTKEKLTQAVIEIIRVESFCNLTITKISHQVGMSRGAMRHHFRTKNNLLIGIIEGIRARITDLHKPLQSRTLIKLTTKSYVIARAGKYWEEFTNPIFTTMLKI